MLNALIIDDKPANTETLQELISLYCSGIKVLDTASGVKSGYDAIINMKPDIVFLDIEMQDGTGFDLLRLFYSIPFYVIFTTAYNQYAVRAFRENALDYLLKPIDVEELQAAVHKAEERISLKSLNVNLEKYFQGKISHSPLKISLPSSEGYIFLDSNDILRCEASGSYSKVYLKNGERILISMHLGACEERLPGNVFFRVHQSHIVNLNYIKKYYKGRGGRLELTDGSIVEVAVSKKERFLDLMKQKHI